MTMNVKFRWLASSLLGAAAWITTPVGAQEDVLVPGGPKELVIQKLEESQEPGFVELVIANVQEVRDEKPSGEKVDGEKTGVAEVSEGEYWLGVQVAAVPEVAKRQLILAHGLAVEDVSPDSPAAKAEIKKFDILLQAGDTPLKDTGDLVKSVEVSQGKEITITLKRGGEARTVRVVAEKRPADQIKINSRIMQPQLDGEIKRLEEALAQLKKKAGDGNLALWFAKPGIVGPKFETLPKKIEPGSKLDIQAKIEVARAAAEAAQAASADAVAKAIKATKVAFPKNLKVEIRKEGDQPAKVHVKQDDQEWEITEDTLKELPEKIRPHVELFLKPGAGAKSAIVSGQSNHTIRVSPDGKVEGELRITPRPPVAPAPPLPPSAKQPIPVAPAAPAAVRTFALRENNLEAKLDTIMKKLDGLERTLDTEVKHLHRELDDLRTKSPGDKK